MNKKIVFTIIVAFLMTVKANAGNNNLASIDYVQSQITILLNYVNSQISNIPVTPTYTIGQHALGGIVFYVDSSGAHGLVAANSQFAPDPFAPGQTWDGGLSSNIGNITVNSTGSGVGAGAMNTSLSVGVQSAYAADNNVSLSGMAAQYCVDFSVQDDGLTACSNPGSVGESCYSDFYLPSLYELNQMFLRNSVLNIYPNNPNEAFFWSSTEDNSTSPRTNAWRINFSVQSAQISSASKNSHSGAWCIRRF
jgi:hypothetical protein